MTISNILLTKSKVERGRYSVYHVTLGYWVWQVAIVNN